MFNKINFRSNALASATEGEEHEESEEEENIQQQKKQLLHARKEIQEKVRGLNMMIICRRVICVNYCIYYSLSIYNIVGTKLMALLQIVITKIDLYYTLLFLKKEKAIANRIDNEFPKKGKVYISNDN